MNQYLVRNTGLVLAAKGAEEGREETDEQTEYNDVGTGLRAAEHRRELLYEPVHLHTIVRDSTGKKSDVHERSFCRQDYNENTDTLFEYLQSILPFNQWECVTVVGHEDQAPNHSHTLFPFYSWQDQTIERIRLVFQSFFESDMLWMEDWPTQLQYFVENDPDRLPGVYVWTFTIKAKGHLAGGGGGGMGASKKVKV
jgi:hypothetical protein